MVRPCSSEEVYISEMLYYAHQQQQRLSLLLSACRFKPTLYLIWQELLQTAGLLPIPEAAEGFSVALYHIHFSIQRLGWQAALPLDLCNRALDQFRFTPPSRSTNSPLQSM